MPNIVGGKMRRSTVRLIRQLILVLALLSLFISQPAPVPGHAQIIFQAEINKSFTPLSIVPGGISRLRVSVFNTNAFSITNTAWTDNLAAVQPGIFLANPVNVDNTCGGTVTAPPGGTVLSLSGGTVPGQVSTTPGSCYVEVDVTSTTPGNLVNTIPVGALTGNGGGGTVANTTPASATLRVSNISAPTVSKRFTPTTVYVGETTTLEVNIRNTDLSNTLTQVSLTDNLPANVIAVGPAAIPTSNCGAGAVVTATAGATSVSISNATIAPNSTCTWRATVTSNMQGVYNNIIPQGAVTTEQGVTNPDTGEATLNVQAIRIVKAFSPTSFQAGSTSNLRITLFNPTSTSYTGATLTDTLPGTPNTNLTIVPGSAITTCGGTVTTTQQSVTLTGGTIPAGTVTNPGTCTITVQVTVSADAPAATYDNTIPAGDLTTTQGVTNVNPATASVSVYPLGTGANASKAFSPSTIQAGDNSRLSITIPAPADATLTNFRITDNLPAGVTVSNSTEATVTNCGTGAVLTAVTGTGVITLTGGTIPAGTSCVIAVSVTSDTGGVYTNTIQPSDITNDQNRSAPRPVIRTLTVLETSDLSVAKAFYPPTVAPGGLSTLTITLTNTNASPLVNVSLTDPLPFTSTTNGVFAAVPLDVSTNCGSGVVNVQTAADDSQTIQLIGGTIPAQVGGIPGTCTITLEVQGLGPNGVQNNIIPINNVSGVIQSSGVTINPTAPATATLTITGLTIGVIKGFNPLTVFGGSASTMSVQLVNPNNTILTGITFVDNMPQGMILANPPNFDTGSCGGTLTGIPGTNSFTFSGGTLLANQSCFLTVSVTMTVNANLTNIIPAGAVTTANGASNPQRAEATLTNLPGASMSKVFLTDPIPAGSFSVLEITIRSTSNVPITGMAFIDDLPGTLPAGLFIAGASAPAPTNTCNGTLTAVPGTQRIELSGGSMPANATCSITVPVSGTVPDTYTNIIPIGALTNDQNVTNTTPTTDTLTLTSAPALLGLAKRVVGSPVAVSPGVWDVTYAIVAQNFGDVPLQGLQINDDLNVTFPAPTTFTVRSVTSSDFTPNAAFNGSTVRNLLSGTNTLNAGQQGEVQVVVRVTPTANGPFLNNASGSANPPSGDPATDISQNGLQPDPDGDGDPTNNNEPTPVSFGPSLFDPPLGVKLVDPGRLPSLRWTVAWVNNTNIVAVNAASSDPIPAGSTFQDNGVASGYPLPSGTHPAGTVASGVACEDTSTLTSTQYCYYEGPTAAYPRGRIVWSGVLGPDFGVTELANAQNEIRISFRVLVEDGVNSVQNVATVDVDRNGDGDTTDPGETRVATATNTWNRTPASPSIPDELPLTGFAPGRVTRVPLQPATAEYAASDGLVLEIPALQVSSSIVGVPLAENGWELDWLGRQVGYLEGTAFPTWNGNSVLTAHVYDANGLPGPFVNLSQLKWGQKVIVKAWGQKYIYEVRSVRQRVRPDDTSVITHEEKPWLTLITCQGYDEASNSYRWRVVVRAVLIKIE
jgi:LPXTG-site transpeptidase (sortase) family protein